MIRQNLNILMKTYERCVAEHLDQWFIPESMFGRWHKGYKISIDGDEFMYYIPASNGSLFEWYIPEYYIESEVNI